MHVFGLAYEELTTNVRVGIKCCLTLQLNVTEQLAGDGR